jgi:hypothetical protein
MLKRRDVLKTLAFAGSAMLSNAADVKRVLVMFKCHLDVGFTDTQAGVTKKYFEVYYPAAMKRAAAMRGPVYVDHGVLAAVRVSGTGIERRSEAHGGSDCGGRYCVACFAV